MGIISSSNLKWYQSATWAQGATHGGDINTAVTVPSSGVNNQFPNVTDDQRIAGLVDYRKIFFRNENASDYTNAKAWIAANTPALNDEISILLGGTKSQTSTPVQLTQTSMAFAASTAVVGIGTHFLTELAVGERVYNGTDDTAAAAKAIASIEDDTHLTLAAAYAGTVNAATQGYVTGIDQCTFVEPISVGDAAVLVLGTLVQNAYRAIWVKRTVTANVPDGYNDNTFSIQVVDT
jgi:hypothetical protein